MFVIFYQLADLLHVRVDREKSDTGFLNAMKEKVHRLLNIRTDVSQNRGWKWGPKRRILTSMQCVYLTLKILYFTWVTQTTISFQL